MKTRAEIEHELFEKYQELNDCKIYALKKAMRKFYSIPLEIDDLEFIAWKAFLETEDKFNKTDHKKKYKNFYRDCLYWRAKDYCMKYSSQKHKTINLADQIDWSTDYKNYVNETREEKILDKVAVEAYLEVNKNNEKGRVAKLFMMSCSIDYICDETEMSKSKLYRLIQDVRNDLNQILEIRAVHN